MSVLSTTAKALYDVAANALPRFLFQSSEAKQEVLAAFAVQFDRARQQLDDWLNYTQILLAVGIWLDEHARDRATSRRFEEADSTLRYRLRLIEDQVTRPALLGLVEGILLEDGVTAPAGYPAMVELRRDRGFFCTDAATSRKVAYFSRGYRMGRERPMSFIVILPYGTPTATSAAISEEIRIKRAGGHPHTVETRRIP